MRLGLLLTLLTFFALALPFLVERGRLSLLLAPTAFYGVKLPKLTCGYPPYGVVDFLIPKPELWSLGWDVEHTKRTFELEDLGRLAFLG